MRYFQSCLDVLPAPQRTTLALRYGLGPLRAHPVLETARRLHVSRSRVRLLERRGIRRLALAGRRTSCEDTGGGASALTGVTGTVVTEAALVAASGRDSATVARGAVAGRSASGGQDRVKAPSGPATLATPFGAVDRPGGLLLTALLAAVLAAGIVLAGRSVLRSVR